MAISGPAIGYVVTIKDNSGSTTLASGTSTETNLVVTESGLETAIAAHALYTYTGTGQFLGFAKTANASTPDYVVGSSITLSTMKTTLYVVEAVSVKYKVKYKDVELATLETGNKLTIKCQKKIMLGGIVIERI